ncbi:tRNA (cytidine(56)-2'-O)-methyltransferase [Thermoplasmatales archaeon SW_10_69_26]|nr:MAG: tRNA (cytidine(56)-2'-O)-methyltransferase [Thermoplasmatales archaeon SW_10_69_26]
MGEVTVLRLGHRPAHDRRISTHLCLTARAFGADRIVFPSVDSSLEATVDDIRERFGGGFSLEEDPEWRPLIREHEGPSIHLTMYGQRHTDALAEIDAGDGMLVIVGAEKVPADVYDLATHNVAVGNQPHSEIAALSTTLLDVLGPDELYAERADAEIVIEPSDRGKDVREVDRGG